MHKVIAFSGGRTSGMMLHRLFAADRDYIVLFCNTGKERDETLDFVHEVEVQWNVPVVWLEYTRVPARTLDATIYPHWKSQLTIHQQQQSDSFTHWFKAVSYETAHRRSDHNTPFDELLGWSTVLPNVRARFCSVQLKIRTMMRYLFSQGIYRWTDFIGIRADEAHRAGEILANLPSYRGAAFPLIDADITVDDVTAFWAAQPFDLQLRSHEGNCDLCFLKATWKRVKIAREDPGAIEWWEGWESDFGARPGVSTGAVFRQGQPFSLIRQLSRQRVLSLVGDEHQDVPCGCGDKGFVLSADDEINCEL